ncbi:MAG: FAD-dependent oxidoreductase [Nanoarchaeota archaeon]
MKRKKIVILGGGITGIVSAYYLSENFDVTLIEKESFLGGSASSFLHKGFVLDFGPHKIYTVIPGIISEINKLCPLLKIKKKNSIYLRGNFYDFPLKLSQITAKMPFVALRAGIDIFLKPFSKLPDDSYENFLINRFGKTLYNLSFRDYAYKVWKSNPKELDAELARRRVAVSGILELIKSVLMKDNKNISAEYFYYPPQGLSQLINSLKSKILKNNGKIILNSSPKITIEGNKVKTVSLNNKTIKPDYVISTIPLDSLVEISNLKEELTGIKLPYQKLNVVYFILNKKRAIKDCWIFFPEGKFIFQRVSEQKAFSPFTSPKDKTAIMVETTKEINPQTIKEIISQLKSIGILERSEIIEYFTKSISKSYPVYKKGFKKSFEKVENFFEPIDNFYLLGRQGLFNYNNMDQCWDMALKISEHIKHKNKKQEWSLMKKYFDEYRIVD